jgi:KaiC/GvpD/RAD55 family RecA-like ATPase
MKKRPVGNLPGELLKFIDNDSYSLLIKGKPGSGKTIFALTLMDNLHHNSNYFYISTRLSVKQLLFFYPWIDKFREYNDSKQEYKFEDARLDEPESLFERITNQLMDVKSPIIIIDTWDAIASFMDRESRLNNERVLQIWRERAGAKLIFLSESHDVNIFDSMVDGVISLSYEMENSRYYRKLHFSKLRGIPINCSQYYFTLFNGYFYVFDPANKLNLFKKITYRNNKRRCNYSKHVSKNNKDFFVRLFKNKLVTLEFDNRISNELISSILLKPLFSLLFSRNLILLNNFQWDLYSLLKNIILSFRCNRSFINNLLSETIDFSKFGINNTYINEKDFIENNNKLDKKIPLDAVLPRFFQNKRFSQDNILNVLDGNNLIHLISHIKFINYIKKLPFNNIIVMRKQDCANNSVLLSESNYYRIFLKENNVLLMLANNPNSIFGSIRMHDNNSIDWFPLY